MKIFAWIAGLSLAAIWISRAVDALFGMRSLPDITGPEWDVPEDAALPRLSVIVPARNEAAHVEQALRSLLQLDYAEYEAIAVDDRSSDATGEILDRLAAENPARLRVIHVEQLPAGWMGKTHAMWRAAQQATGEWLLFTDADVLFRPDALRRAVAFAEQARADHMVLAPKLHMHTWGERMMLAFFQILFVFGHRPWKVADPKARDHIGIGAFNLIRHRVYDQIGTYRALRLAVLDDMKLGQLVKEGGFAQRYALGPGLVSLRWADGAMGVVQNLTKNFFAIMRYRWWMAVGSCLALLFLNLVPFLGVWLAPGPAKIPYVIALLVIFCMYVGSSWHSDVRPWDFFLHPISTVLFAYIMARSMMLTLWHGGVVWRGTKYALEELKQSEY